jgi:K+-transporting ATPase ATPase C chain
MAAAQQLERVAANRHLSAQQLRQLIQRHTEGRSLGLLGEARVNVLELNLDLDRLSR